MTPTEQRARTFGRQAFPWTPKTFEEWVQHAPLAYLMCWDGGHRYDEWMGKSATWQDDGSVMLRQECLSCGLPRDRWIGAAGQIDGNRNKYHYHLMGKFSYPYLFRDTGPFGMPGKAKRARIRVEIRDRRLTEGRPSADTEQATAERVPYARFTG